MTFYLFVSDKQLDKPFPLSVQVVMINADQIVSVYNNR
jgi:hypothetical protein